MRLSIITIFIFSTLGAQTLDFSDFRNLNQYKNPLEDKLKSVLTKEKLLDFVNTKLKDIFLRKNNSLNHSRIDSAIIIKLVSYDASETGLDTTKQVFSYSTLGNTFSRTCKLWNGKEWNNVYRTISTYDFNLRFSKLLSERWLEDHWEGESRLTYDYHPDNRSYTYVEERYDVTSWHNVQRITHEYNSSGSEMLFLSEEWINGSWVYSYKKTVEYDLNNNILIDSCESWDEGNLEATLTSTYTYTSSNKIATYNYEVIQQGRRTYGERYVNSFDDVENIISSEHQEWKNNYWINSVLYTYDYYPDGKLKSFLIQIWTDSTWINFFSRSYVYDERGNEIEITHQEWEDNVLSYIWRESFTYNANNQELTALGESLISDIPQNLYRSEYQYNESGNETYYIYERWIDGKWVGHTRRFTNYDEDGNLIEGIAEKWFDGWKPGNSGFSFPGPDGYYRWLLDYYKVNAYYTKIEPVDYNNPTKFELYQNYPNPFNSKTRIHFTLPNEGLVKLHVFDILGQKITNLINEEMPQGTHTVDFYSTNLPSGVYFYRLVTDYFTQTKKMILLK